MIEMQQAETPTLAFYMSFNEVLLNLSYAQAIRLFPNMRKFFEFSFHAARPLADSDRYKTPKTKIMPLADSSTSVFNQVLVSHGCAVALANVVRP
jgi:hypothetical protein